MEGLGMVQRDLHGGDALPSDDTMAEGSANRDVPTPGVFAKPSRTPPPPAEKPPLEQAEAVVQFVSRAAGPLAMIGVLIGLYFLIF
ncbi:hypothetical protein WG901_14155 [Novosphingobium sp. PS1R-30]|uniref:Uncharacterized protein n=1 Tax=Novosphingobium anseongense TaxID=3133436 RepID=A0ABU8RXJ0_9SPHN